MFNIFIGFLLGYVWFSLDEVLYRKFIAKIDKKNLYP